MKEETVFKVRSFCYFISFSFVQNYIFLIPFKTTNGIEMSHALDGA